MYKQPVISLGWEVREASILTLGFGTIAAFVLILSVVLAFSGIAEAEKTRSNLLTAGAVANIRESQTWQGQSVASILSTASNWMKYTPQQLRDLVPPAWVPRAYDVNFNQSPVHPDEIKKFGRYPWIISPDMPYKIKSPVDGAIYPTNDFDPTQLTAPSDVSSEPYVDNGWGWKKPGETQKYWFVGYYVHWLWHSYLRPAAKALGQAYIITGDQKYATQALVLLDKIAEEYPDMNYVAQSRVGTEIQVGNYPGRVLNNVWETAMVADLAEAYDYAFEGMADNTDLEKATGKSLDKLRRNIETNLLENAAYDIYTANPRIRGNFGMHQKALTTLAIVLDNEHTDMYINNVLNSTGKGIWLNEGVISGLKNFIFRDGSPNESSPGYNSLWIGKINQVAQMLLKRGVDLYKEMPKLKKLFDYPLSVAMLGQFSPNIGDTGTVKGSGIEGWNASLYSDAFDQYGDRMYLTGQPSETASDVMSASGLAMLRTGRSSSGTGISLYYGPGGGHDHYDRLNLELFAEGMRLLPDLGYPEYANAYHKKGHAWTRNTVAHNTVVVNAQRQTTKNGGKLQAFAGLSNVQYTDVRAEEAYPGIVQRYERSLALIDGPGNTAYALDVFRVAGGSEHDYSLHGPDGVFSAENLTLSDVQPGTVAGPNVPFTFLYDARNMETPGYTGPYSPYQGSGFSYLKNVQTAEANGVWSADWNVTGSKVHVRATFVPQAGTEVIVADGEPPKNAVGNPDTLKYVLARTKSKDGKPLQSTFVNVIQLYEDTAFINRVAPLASVTGATGVVGLKIDHLAGTDYVFQGVDGSKAASFSSATFQGEFGIISWTPGGVLRHASLIGGKSIKQGDTEIRTAGSYTGRIEDVDFAGGKVTVVLDDDSVTFPEGDVLAGQRIIISNEQHATEYEILDVLANSNGRYELTFSDPDFLTGEAKASFVTTKPNGDGYMGTPTPMVLNQYYEGQWLVNPATGEGHRIKSFSGSGSSIELVGDPVSLHKGDMFRIYDFGHGDSFKVLSTVDVENEGAGEYRVISNVPATIVLWDGIEHQLVPGDQTVTVRVPTISINVRGQKSDESVTGVVTPGLTVSTPDGLSVSQVAVQLDEETILTSDKVPSKGDLQIDTTTVEDGKHTLTVKVLDSYGKEAVRSVEMNVANYWQVETELQAPIATGFFGTMDFTHIYDKSSGWKFVTGDAASFLNDKDRMVRETDSEEYLVWETPALRSFYLTFYSRAAALGNGLELATSEDGESWIPVSATVEQAGQSSQGWYQLKAMGTLRPNMVRFFRVTLNSKIPAEDVQLGDVSLQGRVFEGLGRPE